MGFDGANARRDAAADARLLSQPHRSRCAPVAFASTSVPAPPLRPMLALALLVLSLHCSCFSPCDSPSPLLFASGAACPANTYNDGHVYTRDGGGFLISNPGFSLASRSFTMEVWVKRDDNKYMCWMAQGTSGGGNGQNLAFCCSATGGGSSGQPVFAQIGNDITATSGFSDTSSWHHIAMVHDQSNGQRTIFLDGSSVGTAMLPAGSPFNPPTLTVTIGKSGTSFWRGWIDELRIFSVAYNQPIVGQHMAGNFWGAAPQLLWLKLDEAEMTPAGTAVADSSGTVAAAGGSVVSVTTSGASFSRQAPGDNGKCLPGFFSSLRTTLISTSQSSYSIGRRVFFALWALDNWGQTMTTYSPALATTTVGVQFQGAGSPGVLANQSATVYLVGGRGTFSVSTDQPGWVGIVLQDLGNGRPTALAAGSELGHAFSPQRLGGPGLTLGGAAYLRPIPGAPGWAMQYEAGIRYGVSELTVTAAGFDAASTTATLYSEGTALGTLAPGVRSARVPLPLTPSPRSAGIPCSLRPFLWGWHPFHAAGSDATGNNVDESGQNLPSILLANFAWNLPSSVADRFGTPNAAYSYQASAQGRQRNMFNPSATELAVSLWFRTSAAPAGLWHAVSGGIGAASSDRGVWLDASGAINARINLLSGGLAEAISTSPGSSASYADGQWHHVVYMYTSQRLPHQLWVDGALRAAGLATSSNLVTLDRTFMGASVDATSGGITYLNGELDDLALFRRALTPAEIGLLYSVTSGPPTPPANEAYCLAVASSADGGAYGLRVVRLPPVLAALAIQVGRGVSGTEGMSEPGDYRTGSGIAALTPAFDPAYKGPYALSLHAFTSGLRLWASLRTPEPEGVFAIWGDAGTSQVVSHETWGPVLPVAVGTTLLRVVTGDGEYSVAVTRATPVLQGLSFSGERSFDLAEVPLPPVSPPFAPGVFVNYTLTVLYPFWKVRVFANYTPADAVVTTMRNVSPEPLPGSGQSSRLYGVTVGLDQAALDMNRYKIASSDGTTVVTITRLPPAVDSITFAGLPASAVVPFVAGDVTPRTVPVLGQALSSLAVTVRFNVGPVTVTVNGAAAGSASSGVPLSLTPFLQSADSDTTTVTLSTLDGDYAFTFSVGCPLPYTCFRVNQGPECEFKCQFCVAGIMRRICLEERPACCGTAGACTC